MDAHIWLLTLRYAGRDWRWASEPCDPVEGTTPRPHLGGLQVDDLEETCTILQATPELRTVALSLPWPSPGIATLIAQGHDLTRARGELALWTPGDDYADREVLVVGRLTEPQYGGPDEDVVCSLEEQPYTDTTTIPDHDAVVNTLTWPSAHTSVVGRVYPQLSGAVGHLTGSSTVARDIPGSVAPTVDTAGDVILLAGHGVLAASVTVWDSAGTSATVAVTEQDDGLGRRCSVADISASGLTLGEAEYGVTCDGGRPDTDGASLQYAGRVLLWALAQSGIRVDWHRVRAVAPLLDWLVVVVDIEDTVSPWDWVQDHLLPLLPVSVASGGDGLYLIPWRYDARGSDAVVHLVAGEGCCRDGLVTYDSDGSSLVNECTVKYGFNAYSGDLEEYVTVTGYPDEDDPRQRGSQAARLSQDALRDDELGDDGIRSETIEAPCLCSERAAVQVASWRVSALSRPRRVVTYWLSTYRDIRLGTVVSLTDDDLSWNRVPCLVQGRVLSDRGDLTLTLLVLSDTSDCATLQITGSLAVTSLPTVYLT